jgi:hypothetical protein
MKFSTGGYKALKIEIKEVEAGYKSFTQNQEMGPKNFEVQVSKLK